MRTIYADQVVAGMKIITATRKRPVEILHQLSDPGNAHYFEFAAKSASGHCALRLHRSETVQVVAA